MRSRTHALDPDIATKFTTMEAMVSDSIATQRLRAMLVGLLPDWRSSWRWRAGTA